MKYLNKYMFALLAVSTMLTACGDDDDNYAVGEPTNADALNVYFEADQSIVMASTATSFDFTVSRNKDNGAITVPLTYHGEDLTPFALPQSVSFASGELQKTITVTCSDAMKMFNEYRIEVIIDPAYTTQYKAQVEGYPRATLDIVKEDYKTFATGTYTSAWTEVGEPATLEFSEILGMYRFKNITSGNLSYDFTVGDKPMTEGDFAGLYPITFGEGILKNGCVTSEDWAHPSYGIVTIYGDESAPSAYSKETKTYYLSIEFTVSAGSFGAYYDTFVAD